MLCRLMLALAFAIVFMLGQTVAPSGSSWVRPKTIAAQSDCQAFPETGKQVCGIFLSYWRANGGLAQQGYPISDVLREESSDGKTYDTQYFERAVFERHPENAGTRFEVLLALLGRERYDLRYPAGPLSGVTPLEIGRSLVIADPFSDIQFNITVTDIQRGTTYSNETPKGIFIIVSLRATNIGLEPESVPSFDIKDQLGRTFDAKYSSYTTIQPSLTDNSRIVFDVAPDAATFTIIPPEKCC